MAIQHLGAFVYTQSDKVSRLVDASFCRPLLTRFTSLIFTRIVLKGIPSQLQDVTVKSMNSADTKPV